MKMQDPKYQQKSKSMSSPEQNYISLFAMRYPVCHFPTFKQLISLSRVLLYGRPFTFFVAFNFQSIFCLLSRICQLVQNTLGTIHKGRLLKGVGRWVHQKEIYYIRLFSKNRRQGQVGGVKKLKSFMDGPLAFSILSVYKNRNISRRGL